MPSNQQKAAAAKASDKPTDETTPTTDGTDTRGEENAAQVDGSGATSQTTDSGATEGAGSDSLARDAAAAGTTSAGQVAEDRVVVSVTDRIEGVYGDAEGGETYVTITKDVIEEFYYPGTKRPAQRVLFAKGQVVPKSQIDALNANVDARRKAAESDEVALVDYVDSSTLASGTGARTTQQ